MKGCLPRRMGYGIRRGVVNHFLETAMRTSGIVTQIGLDTHRKFSKVTGRDAEGHVVWRQRLDHADRGALRERLRQWPGGHLAVPPHAAG